MRRRTDFFEPVWGWRIWRQSVKSRLDGDTCIDADGDSDRGGPTGLDEKWEAPDYVEPVIGWRVWRVIRYKRQYLLSSLYNNVVWSPGAALDADCFAAVSFARHRSPSSECRCGIYASRREALAWALLGNRALAPLAVGRVNLWGLVSESEYGWRAEHGYPERIFVPRVGDRLHDHDYDIASGLENYGVPVSTVLVEQVSSLLPVVEILCGNELESAPPVVYSG